MRHGPARPTPPAKPGPGQDGPATLVLCECRGFSKSHPPSLKEANFTKRPHTASVALFWLICWRNFSQKARRGRIIPLVLQSNRPINIRISRSFRNTITIILITGFSGDYRLVDYRLLTLPKNVPNMVRNNPKMTHLLPYFGHFDPLLFATKMLKTAKNSEKRRKTTHTSPRPSSQFIKTLNIHSG